MDEINKVNHKSKMNETDSISFLLEEYRQSYEHMRHYDNVKDSLAKFSLSFYSIIATIVFAFVQYFTEKVTNDIYLELGIFLFFVTLAGLILIIMLVQNRIYFVLNARQVNSIRKEFIALNKFSFQNFLFIDTDTPATFNPRSNHTLILYFISLVNSIFFSFSVFFILNYFEIISFLKEVLISVLSNLILLILEIFFIVKILKNTRIGS